MSDNSQNVENPMELLALFPQGVYVFNDRPAFRFEYEGNYARRVLNVFSLEGKDHLHPALAGPLDKIMGALKLDGKLLQAGDFAVLNVKKLEIDVTFEDMDKLDFLITQSEISLAMRYFQGVLDDRVKAVAQMKEELQ